LSKHTARPGVNVSVFHASFDHVTEDLREDSCDNIPGVTVGVRTVDNGPGLEAFLPSSIAIIQCTLKGRDGGLAGWLQPG
jgi:hypothetical protein